VTGSASPGSPRNVACKPQITVGLLTDAAGFPLMVNAFEATLAETTTMLPVIKAFMAAHRLKDVVIVADAGMISENNMKAIEAAGLSFILGMKIGEVPYVVAEWRKAHPDTEIADGQVFVQPWPAGPTAKRKDQVRYYQYKHDRARRTLKGIDEQVRKAEQALAGKTAVKRNRFVKLTGAAKAVNRELEAKARALAGIKGYVTNIADPTSEQVIGAYQRLFQIEKSFRMAKSDLVARPIYHRTKDSIQAHLTIVFAALAVSRWIEDTTGWSIKKFVKTVRRYRTIQIQAGEHVITAADPLPDDVHQTLEAIKTRAATH
jgi:transposase